MSVFRHLREGESRLLHREQAEAVALHRHRGPPPKPGPRPRILVDIAFGGALGSLCRYLLTEAVPAAKVGFPWGTFLVNMLGCLLIGALTVYLLSGPPHRYVRMFAVTGYLGGFTTFSHFIDGLHTLGDGGRWTIGVSYAVAGIVIGWVAVWAGMAGARVFVRRGGGTGGTSADAGAGNRR